VAFARLSREARALIPGGKAIVTHTEVVTAAGVSADAAFPAILFVTDFFQRPAAAFGHAGEIAGGHVATLVLGAAGRSAKVRAAFRISANSHAGAALLIRVAVAGSAVYGFGAHLFEHIA